MEMNEGRECEKLNEGKDAWLLYREVEGEAT